jgi:hypothetical protein
MRFCPPSSARADSWVWLGLDSGQDGAAVTLPGYKVGRSCGGTGENATILSSTFSPTPGRAEQMRGAEIRGHGGGLLQHAAGRSMTQKPEGPESQRYACILSMDRSTRAITPMGSSAISTENTTCRPWSMPLLPLGPWPAMDQVDLSDVPTEWQGERGSLSKSEGRAEWELPA